VNTNAKRKFKPTKPHRQHPEVRFAKPKKKGTPFPALRSHRQRPPCEVRFAKARQRVFHFPFTARSQKLSIYLSNKLAVFSAMRPLTLVLL
jgi:hypothetical protein